MTANEERKRFALIAFSALAASLLLWLPAVDIALALLRPLAAMLAGMFGLARSITPSSDNGWTIWTNLIVTSGAPGMVGKSAGLNIGAEQLRYLLRGVPIFLALMAAPPWGGKLATRFAIGLAAMALVFVLSAVTVINCRVAVVINHAPSPADSTLVPPDFLVSVPSYDPFAFFLASVGYYLALMALPLLTPVILWLALKPQAIALLLRGSEPQPAEAGANQVPS